MAASQAPICYICENAPADTRDHIVPRNLFPKDHRENLWTETITRLLEAASGPHRGHLRPLIIAALQTGCRRGELLGMRWEDVNLRSDPGRITIRNTKNNRVHHVIIDPIMRKVLIGQREWQMRRGLQTEWVF